MLGKILGAVVGDKVAERYGKSGVIGAALGAGAATLIRRAGPLGLVVIGGVAAASYLRGKKKAAADSAPAEDVTPTS